ncbi:chromosome partitioning protein ParA [Rickettsia amblyommatis]|uniref:Chromosome partitioning protein ParA n=2 Tax=Rickettsia amblyommatis TaxID=33989 RepID=H8K3Y7_RICAG|nr:AAA family ATPase [Rickettsia amblyommatis]AFC69231.1 chromosome partitioning ATPase [Rickettsia amblyommatis str. GAT-30V]ALA61368.1 chromosome partitioning protein ParA [Rickettsia amblyommatis]ARD87478.1 chromosome partitioning protein ParA [Rickettsia amblyommatis]KJV61468.1 cobQ/CobB/MinD/ParA nucleotide binding domain protein [Rickettsia amblyommatis str. Ac/Pa]KJV97740.1 cobQ/CobB/MinD/ParA nucleotide binding domain protein [Rickettsia amblyommatis str. Darkwater]
MKVIAIVNQKGGVAKTTTTVNLATAFAAVNKKILVIDLDPQGNSSTGFGISQQQRKNTIYQVLTNLIELKDAIISTDIPNLEIITSNTNLSAAELDLTKLKDREYILIKLLEEIKILYDYIIIDCPPSLNLLTVNALVASDEVLIPMQCDFYSLEGLSHLLKTIEIVEKKLNPKIKIAGILFTMYDKRNRLTEQVEDDVRKCLGELVFKTVIPRNIKLSEAPSYGKPAIIYDYKCSGAVAYIELTKEILERYGEK